MLRTGNVSEVPPVDPGGRLAKRRRPLAESIQEGFDNSVEFAKFLWGREQYLKGLASRLEKTGAPH